MFSFLVLLFLTFSLTTSHPANPVLDSKLVKAEVEDSDHTVYLAYNGPELSTIRDNPAACTLTTISQVVSYVESVWNTQLITALAPISWTLSTFSEVSPIWSDGSVTLTTLVAGSGFAVATSTMTSFDVTSIILVTTRTGATTVFATPSPSIVSVPETVVPDGVTSITSTVIVLPSETTTDAVSSTTTPSSVAFSSGTKSGAVSYTTNTSKAAAPTLVAGLGGLLGVAVGAVALL
jgi:hypothetical protein